ncbi:MAG: heparinase II/III family protein [Cephaloticoccus sp.]|nr:heparinase II/III family protein [Cephaloticoccus sp.]
MALCDPEIWVEWRDKSHVHLGIPADLRTGWISRDVAIAYNWLRSSLTKKQRQRIVDGLDRMGIQPFLKSLPMNPQWMQRPTNWMTCVVGGMGICGMSLGRDHPAAAQLVHISKPKMAAYLKIFGSEGEFNESPGYAGSIMLVVKYYSALACIESDEPNRLAAFPFPQAAKWIQHLALGPKRLAAFGDSHPDASPFVAHYAAVAAATNNPVIQGLAQHYRTDSQGYVAPDVYELIWFDPVLPAKKPGEEYPRYATFKAHAACFSSRTDWKISGPDCVVYGKAGREPHHAHPDAGQVCIDAHGSRLITDLGLPAGGYPADYFGRTRYEYYNASVLGHNLLTLDDQEQPDTPSAGHYLSEGLLPNEAGVYWLFDLSACHPRATRITRAVIHFLPGVIAVVDDAHARGTTTFRLRWHTIKPVKPTAAGVFKFTAGGASLSARMQSHGRAKITFQSGRHAYRAPYHCNRLGEKLTQRREPYVDALSSGINARILSAFATGRSNARLPAWTEEDGALVFRHSGTGNYILRLDRLGLHYQTPKTEGILDLSLMHRSSNA